MLKVKRFLGFTDGIKEPRKTKVENELSTRYRYNGNIYSAVEFLCLKLLEGCYPDKEENYQYYKRNGELSKPKTVYKYYSPDGETYFEMNKTQYDFVCYLMADGLNTEESILAYDKADIERVEALKRAEEEEKAQQEEQRRKAEEDKEKFNLWMREEARKIPQFQKDIVDAIFLNIYGQQNTLNYTIIPCINNYDDPMCKAEIISRLHNDNKASIKIFECLTGLKLPKGYKERIAYLEGLTAADFKEAVDYYKPRKKSGRNKKELEEFYISERHSVPDGYTWGWIKVIAEPVEKYGVKMFIREANGHYTLSLEESGGLITSGKTKSECMNKLKSFVDARGNDGFLKQVEEFNKMIAECAGKNPLYETA